MGGGRWRGILRWVLVKESAVVPWEGVGVGLCSDRVDNMAHPRFQRSAAVPAHYQHRGRKLR